MLAHPSQENNSGNFAALLGMLTTSSGLQIRTTIRWQQIEICNSMFPCSSFLVSTYRNCLLGLPSILFCSHLSCWPRQISRCLCWFVVSLLQLVTMLKAQMGSPACKSQVGCHTWFNFLYALMLNVCRDSWAQLPKWLCEPCKRHSCFKDSKRIWFLTYLIWSFCKTVISNTCLL